MEMLSTRNGVRLGIVSGLMALVLGTMSGVHAAAVSGDGANVTWVSNSLGATSASGTFACGVSATVSMTTGKYNSGIAFPVDWSTSSGTSGAFTGGISPASSIAVYADSSGNSGTISFGADITDPVVLVTYIDPGAAMDFGPNPITVLSSYSSAAGSPTIVGNKISLDGPHVDTDENGWAVKVTGTFGPTGGPLPLTVFATEEETFAISVASPTICPPDPPGQPGSPTVAPTRGGLRVTVTAPTTGGAPASYLVTASPGGRTCTVTGASGSCTITGLSHTRGYTVTVVATNAGGDSPASSASDAVTPLEGSSDDDALPTVGRDHPLAVLGALALLAGWWLVALARPAE